MTAPNVNALWGRTLVDELAAAGVAAAAVAPGSRSTPLTTALAAHDAVETTVHLDERSAAFLALGRGRRTGTPAAVVCTSGTAAANFHPAVLEADRGRVPLVLLTADRPPELRDSGANQTVDQAKLYGDAVRWYRDLAEPAADARKLRSLRTTAARAVAAATGVPAGPVHLNVPFRKPLAPVEVPGDVPPGFETDHPLAARGRDGPFVRTARGRPTPEPGTLDEVASAVAGADRGLVVAGPATPPPPDPGPLAELARATGFPLVADPLSGLRFGPHVPDTPVVGGYDSFLDAAGGWPDPEVVLRFGTSPTSKALRSYLAESGARQFVVDPAGWWPEAEFAATDLVAADPVPVAAGLVERLDGRERTDEPERPDERESGDRPGSTAWRDRWTAAEAAHWEAVETADAFFEGSLAADVVRLSPDPATVFVSNSMPVRDVDRFGRPRAADLTVLGNRGASGVDGVVSTAVGAGAAADGPLVALVGDVAFFHDTNGLLALSRCDVDATVVLVDNDGGGIFHMLPIEDFDPPFTEYFRTPHGLDFAPTAERFGLGFERVEDRESFREAFRASVGRDGTQVVAAAFDAGASHRTRERVHEDVCDRVRERVGGDGRGS